MKRQCEELKLFNSKLKAKQKEVCSFFLMIINFQFIHKISSNLIIFVPGITLLILLYLFIRSTFFWTSLFYMVGPTLFFYLWKLLFLQLYINGPKDEYKIPNLEINNAMKLNDIIKNSVNTSDSTTENQEQRIHHANNFGLDPTTSLGVMSSSSSSMGRNSGDMGPLSIPDLNISFEAIKDLSKVMADQARQRRIHILRLKKNNAKEHQSSSSR